MPANRFGRRIALIIGLSLSGPALAATPALVVDVDSGKVIYAERATDPWYPASITKLMTTYVALEMVRGGKASMEQLLTLSPEAAAQPPSKMGFAPGTQLRLDNALKIIMVKSANDIAMMIGENLGGSVDGYAAMMNEAAQRLGMKESRWFNQNGLPDERQQTSARDMAILGRALLRDFPEHAGLFQIGGLKFGKAVMRNHNGLLGRYPGADGMKTGFICAGGFNVVASATRNGRRLIAVVMGHRRAAERDLLAADLFDKGFETTGFSFGAQTLDGLAASNLTAPPNMRPMVCGGGTPSEDDAPALVAGQPSGTNAENAINLFAPSALAFASTGSAATPRRTTLGPRVAFDPIPVWIGATPGATAVAEQQSAKAKPVRVAARPVRTKLLARSGAALPSGAQAFAAPELRPVIAEDKAQPSPKARIETLKTVAKPVRRAALEANVTPKATLAVKPAVAPKAPVKAKAAVKPQPKAQAALQTKPVSGAAAVKPKATATAGLAKPAVKRAAPKPALKPVAAKPKPAAAE